MDKYIHLPQYNWWVDGILDPQKVFGAEVIDGFALCVVASDEGLHAWGASLVVRNEEGEDITSVPFRECLIFPSNVSVQVKMVDVMQANPAEFMNDLISQAVADSVTTLSVERVLSGEIEIVAEMFGDSLTIRMSVTDAHKIFKSLPE